MLRPRRRVLLESGIGQPTVDKPDGQKGGEANRHKISKVHFDVHASPLIKLQVRLQYYAHASGLTIVTGLPLCNTSSSTP